MTLFFIQILLIFFFFLLISVNFLTFVIHFTLPSLQVERGERSRKKYKGQREKQYIHFNSLYRYKNMLQRLSILLWKTFQPALEV